MIRTEHEHKNYYDKKKIIYKSLLHPDFFYKLL